ncbi:MAG: hypothetical protein ACM35G_02840 [Planctomycetaceae bacterium]
MLGLPLQLPMSKQSGVAVAVALGLAMLTIRAGSEDASPAASGPVWREGHPVPIAVAAGRATFEVATPRPGSRTLVVVSALAKAAGPFPIRLTARSAALARAPTPATDGPRRAPQLATPPLAPIAEPVAGVPARARTFHLMVRDGDVASASNYLAVAGLLRAVGHRVQVYVDARDVEAVGAAVLRDLVATFDDAVFPTAARTFGQARDVDGDGRFTVLISSWLTRLAGGRYAVDGFVRGADFDPSLGTPFGNRCDMMYLSTALGPGPHLRTILAHEYTHAVTISAKALAAPGASGGRLGPEEEGWLDEALAHLVEDLHGFSRSNLDYRVSAFLSQPERYRLVVEDYFAADLFRSHGNRGGTYLFLRWCVDRFGPDLIPALIRSDRRGTANLERATGTTFAELYRQWSTALYLSGLGVDRGHDAAFRSLNMRGPFDAWELAGPRTALLRPDGPAETWSAAGTSSHYVVVEGAASGAVAIEVLGPPEAELQVTAVPLPADLARIELTVRLTSGPGGDPWLHARVRERQGRAVRLSALAWEPLVPAANPHAAGFRRDGLDMLGVASAFGTSALPALGQLDSRPIRLAGASRAGGPLIVKAIGTDALGRRVAAWAEIPPIPPEDEPTADGVLSRPRFKKTLTFPQETAGRSPLPPPDDGTGGRLLRAP